LNGRKLNETYRDDGKEDENDNDNLGVQYTHKAVGSPD